MAVELHIACAPADRQPGRLDSRWTEPGSFPQADALLASAQAAPPADRWLLSGGEPTLRPDLPDLIRTVAAQASMLGMRTDGLLLARPGIGEELHEAGLRFVRIPLHSGRADAHDWLVRLPGASKRTRKAIDLCTAGPLSVEAEITITRPTTPYLLETVSLLIRAGVSTLRLRPVTRAGAAADDYIALAPRLGLLQPILEEAVAQGLRHGLQVEIEGLPLCAVPNFPECLLKAEQVLWSIPAPLQPPEHTEATPAQCLACPGPPQCEGVSPGYTHQFGWSELRSEGGPQTQPQPPTPMPRPVSGDSAVPPPARAGRSAATRVQAAARQAEVPNLGGDPLGDRRPEADGDPSQVLRVEFKPEEPTRALRMRLVQAAQHGANTLRIDGASLQHTAAHDLLREAQRLSFAEVEVTGEGSPLDQWTDNQILHLRGLSRLDLVFYGADAGTHDQQTGVAGSFDAALRVAERVARIATIPVGALAGNDDAALTDALGQPRGPFPPQAPPPRPAILWTDEAGATTPLHSR